MRYHLIKEKTFDLCREASQKNAQIKTLSFKAGGCQFKNLIIFQLKKMEDLVKETQNKLFFMFLFKEGGRGQEGYQNVLIRGRMSK